MRWAKYEKSLSRDDVVFVYDTQRNGNVEGVLRVLPALLYSGFAHATCPKSWLQLERPARHELLKYRWHRLQDIADPTFDLVAATTQYYENNLAVYSLRQLVNKFTRTDQRIVLIGDRPDFELSGTVRPLPEDPVVDRAMGYDEIYTAFEERYELFNSHLPLQETKNLFLHDNANLYELATGTRLSTIQDLIEVLPEAPYLPIVRGLSSIFASSTGLGSDPLESTKALEAFGKWLRRRIEVDYTEGLSLARTINDYATTHERLFDRAGRTRMPEMAHARDARHELTPDENPIHARYHTWLSEAI